jgi:hypothetical protein
MKKIILTIAVVLTATIANAQLREKGAIELAPQIGYATANYYGENNLNNNSLGGVAFGLGADYFFNDRWSLRSGLLYQPMGSDLGGGFKEKINYLTLPVNANWHFGSTRKWNLNFGPSIGFVMSAKFDGNDIKDLVVATQVGLNYGIGYKIFVNEKFSILIDYQGMTGLTGIDDSGDTSLKNIYGSFNLGAVIKL